ncbi:MAG: hypothetical protein GC161_16020 [Planctomycetaceae bacterium]|nr:hypothetical protein [Planctomycetaceae bacterium]
MDLCRYQSIPWSVHPRRGAASLPVPVALAVGLLAAVGFAANGGSGSGATTGGGATAGDPVLRTPAEVAALRRAARAEQAEAGPAGGPRAGQRGAPRGENLGGANRANYRIHARLDADGRNLVGAWDLTWTNGSDAAASDLRFHLYYNAFANDRSVHASVDRDLGDRLAERDQKGDGFGFSKVTGLWLVDGEQEVDLLPSLRFLAPDDYPDDRTVFAVDLPRPVAGGETATLRLEWSARVPRAERRTGQKDDFLLMAQWFPKLGVWEGERGWNCHNFHAWTEWYADFGTYDVRLDLPAEYADRVGGSGLRVSSEVRGDRVEARFVAPSESDRERTEGPGRTPRVHDFTWTADPGFATHRSTFRYADWAARYPAEVERARAAFGPDTKLELRDVEVLVLLQPEREAQGPRHAEATEAALFFYGLWYGEYPFERITVVDPAWGSRAGGMEYPTLFTAGTRLLTRASMHVPESVTIHEAGHQWFYGMVANNEFEAAWIDEGLNSYTDSEVLVRVFGPRVHTTDYASIPVDGTRVARFGSGTTGRALALRELPMRWLGVKGLNTARPLEGSGFIDWWRDQPWLTAAPRHEDPRHNDRQRYLTSPDQDPIDNLAWHAVDRSSHYTNTYARTAVALRSLPGAIAASLPGRDGWAAFHRGMRGFATDWRWRHPYPDDFFAAMQRHLGEDLDLTWYFEELFRGTGTVDWSLEVSQHKQRDPRGWFPGEDGAFAERKAAESEEGEAAEADQHRVEVVLRKEGTLALPVVVELTFADGSQQRFTWTREQQLDRGWFRWSQTGASELVSAVLDPERTYQLDTDQSNDRWYKASDDVAPWRWAERAGSQFLRQLHFQAGIGG